MLFAAVMAAALGSAPRILVPPNGAHPRSQWVAVEVESISGSAPGILVDGHAVGRASAGPKGQWEMVARTGIGAHTLRACGETDCSAAISIVSVPARTGEGVVDYSVLRTGDVILDHGRDSEQEGLYRATYTHAAIYLGGDEQGTPLIGEAVNADISDGDGEVRAVPPEESLAFSAASRAGVFRLPDDADLERKAARWVTQMVNQGGHFWSATLDFAGIYRLWRLWDFDRDRPFDKAQFAAALGQLRERKLALDRFNCATLVWRAFYEASGHQLDLSEPNRALEAGSVLGVTTPALLSAIRSAVVMPDTLALSGKLRLVQ